MNLTDLQREAHAIAKEHGRWDTERTFGDCIALVHSELSEALEAYRKTGWPWLRVNEWRCDVHGEPMGVASELADVVIRVADMAEWYGVGLEFPSGDLMPRMPTLYFWTFGDWITYIHSWVAGICGCYWDDNVWWKEATKVVIGLTYRMAAHYGIDLDAAIEAKMAYNRTGATGTEGRRCEACDDE